MTTTPVCRECGHSEHDHKYYPADDSADTEERWECRHSADGKYCDCVATWSDTPWSDD